MINQQVVFDSHACTPLSPTGIPNSLLGSTAAERQEKEEAGSDGGVEGFEPQT